MAQSMRRCYCSVPGCSNNKQSHPYMSYHDFPKDASRCALWLRAIRRDEGPTFRVQRGSTYVCSFHFRPEELYETKRGLTVLKNEVVPSRFYWNGWGNIYQRPTKRLCCEVPNECVEAPGTEDVAQGQAPKAAWDHDYAACPPPSKRDGAARKTKDLELQLMTEIMTRQSQEAKQTDREPEEKLEIKASFQNKRIPANALCGNVSQRPTKRLCCEVPNECVEAPGTEDVAQGQAPKAAWDHDYAACPPPSKRDGAARKTKDLELQLMKEILTQQSQEATQSCARTRGFPANVLRGESSDGLQLQDHLHIKKEEEELWESVEVKQETDITAVTVKSEDEEEEAQCSLLHWRQSEENIKGEPATCSSAKVMKVEPNGDISEGPEAANTCTQPDTDGEETDCSDTEDSEDWREPLSQSEAQSEHMDMSCDSFHTSENNTQKPFGCDLCGEKFRDRCLLKVHTIIHTREKPFGCDVCGKLFSRKANLKRHTIIHTGRKPISCVVCEKTFCTISDLKQHKSIHTGQKTCVCDICGKRCSNRSNLKTHKRIHIGQKPYDCDVSQKLLIQKGNLNRPMKIHTRAGVTKRRTLVRVRTHRGGDVDLDPQTKPEELWEIIEEKQKSDITAVTVNSEAEEEEAQCSLLHWRQTEENIKGEPATCSSAKLMNVEPNGDISEGPEAANTSTQPDTDGEETDCSDTEDSEGWREPLSQSEAQSEHMDMSCDSFQTSENSTKETSHNRDKPFGCDVCGKQFSRQSNLKFHMRIHIGEKRFGCEVYGEQFIRKESLFMHSSSHTLQTPFGCDVCGKQFGTKTQLNVHTRIHTGEKPYGCDICQKIFFTWHDVIDHMTIHTGEKPYGCDVCDKRFSKKASLKSHMRVHTGEKPYGCDDCG